MIKIIKYNDPKFENSLEKIIQSKRMDSKEIRLSVTKILNDIKINKDKALFKYAKKFDNVVHPSKD
jgi:histidinol dehydrogenase